jgi:hypothetical protein
MASVDREEGLVMGCDARCSAVQIHRDSRRGFKKAFIIAAAGVRDHERSRKPVSLRYWSRRGP